MKPSDQNRNRGVRNYAGTGVTIFIVTLIGTSVGLLAGLYIARTAENNHHGLVDAFTVAAEVMVAVGSVTLVWFFLWEGTQLTKTVRLQPSEVHQAGSGGNWPVLNSSVTD